MNASIRLNIINENLISTVINFVWLCRTKMCFRSSVLVRFALRMIRERKAFASCERSNINRSDFLIPRRCVYILSFSGIDSKCCEFNQLVARSLVQGCERQSEREKRWEMRKNINLKRGSKCSSWMNGKLIFRGEARRLRYTDAGEKSFKQIFTAC